MSRVYDSASELQRLNAFNYFDRTLRYFSEACQLPGPVRFLEIGSATGYNSVCYWNKFLDAYEKGQPFELVFSDLIFNDWNRVFENAKAFEAHRNYSLMTFACTAGNFIKALQPPSSINFAFSNATIHFLTEFEPTLESFGLANIKGTRVSEMNAAFAQRDLENILKARAYELKPGGIFVALYMTYLPPVINQILTESLHKLISEELISEAEGLQMNFAANRRSRKDFERANEATGNLFEILEYEVTNYTIKFTKTELSAFARGPTEVRVTNAIRKSRPHIDPTPIVNAFYQYAEDNAPEEPIQGKWKYCVLRRVAYS
eukprot:CAMPEP_0204898928 /NCGR_PEP_ID=MMETSP1397-20131031/1561_1 /ASSEMBLY_ACC=CAM_ASM_000891 /TAXON_ID=49980 /ORGANISM="Climacostomum Climacostomum virens, Strain Stock W-24" /LENGTH=317 /DNA_ID=CAMNT_0052066821 /DNA_START=33 /DNA_END=986 /DNA_ORIENTATION=+